MNHIQILKRSWNILWSYRALWVFGIIMALTGGAYQSNAARNYNSGQNSNRPFRITPPAEMQPELDRFGRWIASLTHVSLNTWIAIGIALLCLILILIVITRIANYVSRVALIRMVASYEETGEKATWRQGLRFGWSRAAWRLFLIDLSIFLPIALAFILVIACMALPFLAASDPIHHPPVPAIVAAVGVTFIMIFVAIILFIALSIIMNFIQRTCVLEDTGVFDSIRRGWGLVKDNFIDILLMWLIIIGVRIAYLVVMIPVVFLLLGISALLGGGLGFLMYLLLAGSSTISAIITAVIVGLALFLLIFVPPLAFLGGLRETFISTDWTLTYRALFSPPQPDLEMLTQLEEGPQVA
jgi:hypothetical protein